MRHLFLDIFVSKNSVKEAMGNVIELCFLGGKMKKKGPTRFGLSIEVQPA